MGTWKTRCIDLIVNVNNADDRKPRCIDLVADIGTADDNVVTIIDPFEVDKFVKRNTKAGCQKTRCIKPIVNVVRGNDNATIIQKIIAYILHPPPPPKNGTTSSMSSTIKKKLNFSPEAKIGVKNKRSLLTSATKTR